MKNRRNIREFIIEYLRGQVGLLVILGILFIAGVIIGALSVNSLGYNLKGDLFGYFKDFLAALSDPDRIHTGIALKKVLWNNVRLVLIVWFSGLIVIGIPVILVSVIIKGFVIGFTVSFLAQEMGIKGVFLAFVSILPQNLFAIPLMLVLCSTALSFAMLLIRKRFFDKTKRLRINIGGYALTGSLLGFLLMMTALIEVYISPVFMKLVMNMMT